MSSKIVTKNNLNTELTIIHENDTPALTIGTEQLRNMLTNAAGVVTLANLPTTDPAIVDRIWNDSGILKISTGV